MPRPNSRRTAPRHGTVAPATVDEIAPLLSLGPDDDPLGRLAVLGDTLSGGRLAIVEGLGHSHSERAADVLQSIALRSDEKELRKAARRSLHRLRAAGLRVDVPAAGLSPSLISTVESPRLVEALSSYVDGIWSRSLWLVFERSLGGANVFGFVLNYVVGVKDVTFRDTTRRRFGRDLAGWSEKTGMTLREIPPDHALGLISEALELNEESGFSVPKELRLHLAVLGHLPPVPDQPLIYQHVSRGQTVLMPDLADRTPELLDEEEMKGWIFGFEESIEFARERRRLQDSPILLAGASREEREERVLATAISGLFTSEVRRAAGRGLEENAYILWMAGRERAARIAVAAAVSLGQGSLVSNPFARAMVQRSLELALELERSDIDPALVRRGPYDPVD